MNNHWYKLARNTGSSASPQPAVPQVWSSESYVYNEMANTITVTWVLHSSVALTEDLTVQVYHSHIDDGQSEPYPWTLPAGQTSVSAPYTYSVPAMVVADLVFGISAGSGYSMPDSVARPKEVVVNIATATGTAPTGGGNPNAKTIPDKNAVNYETAPLALTNADIVNGAITLENLNIYSNDNMVPAIDISAISQPVHLTVHNCILNTLGIALYGPYVDNLTLTFTNNIVFTPDKTQPDTRGWGSWGIRIGTPVYATIEHNYCEDRGLCMIEYDKNKQAVCQGYSFRYNYAKNVYGQGDFQNFFKVVSEGAVIPGQLTEYNQTLNIDDQCRLEDTFSFYHTSGTQASPAIVRHNFLDGASKSFAATSYTGGGVMVDCASTATVDEMPKWWQLTDNQAVRLHNYCFAVAGGQDCGILRNRAVVAAVNESGVSYNDWTSGMWTGNYNGLSARINVADNVVGVNDLYGGRTTEYMFNDNETNHTTGTNNTSLAGPITRATEDNEYTIWNQKLSTNNITIGPLA